LILACNFRLLLQFTDVSNSECLLKFAQDVNCEKGTEEFCSEAQRAEDQGLQG